MKWKLKAESFSLKKTPITSWLALDESWEMLQIWPISHFTAYQKSCMAGPAKPFVLYYTAGRLSAAEFPCP